MSAPLEHIPKAVHTDSNTGMEDDPVTQGGTRVEDHVRVKDAPPPYPTFAPNDRMCTDPGSFANRYPCLENCVGSNAHIGTERDSAAQDGRGMNLGFLCDRGVEEIQKLGENTVRVLNGEAGTQIGGQTLVYLFGDKECSGLARW
jgi:hypothetical protein